MASALWRHGIQRCKEDERYSGKAPRDKVKLVVKMMPKKIMFPHPPGFGGPGSFQERIEVELRGNGFRIHYSNESILPDIILVVGGTKRLAWLIKMRQAGVPVIYRLDGISWIHRKKNVGLVKFLKAEYRNLSNKFIHAFLADHIIYQSEFVKKWWEKSGWKKRENFTVVRNGVDLNKFSVGKSSQANRKIVFLEGKIDYTPYAVSLIAKVKEAFSDRYQIDVYGDFEDEKSRSDLEKIIPLKGSVSRDKVPEVLRDAVYISLDILPACPNTVIEAMACGSPVVAFDTGAIAELIPPQCGKVIPYGSNPWSLAKPNIEGLVNGIEEILNDWDRFSVASRVFSESQFNIADVVQKYITLINCLLKKAK